MRCLTRCLALAALSLFPLIARPALAQEWQWVGTNKVNLSGMALYAQSGPRVTFLTVQDNKKPDEPHATLLTMDWDTTLEVTPLTWPTDQAPVDLESISALPDTPGVFLALASAGKAYLIRVNPEKKAIEIQKSFDLPKPPVALKEVNYEGVSVAKVDGATLLVWGYRGASATPAVLYWCRFDATSGPTGPVQSANLTLPYPTRDVRHLADLRVDNAGTVYVTAASDPGDDGPFSSALYVVGTLTAVKFLPTANPTLLRRFAHHKVEAFDLVPGKDGGLFFGTDDESLGTWVARND